MTNRFRLATLLFSIAILRSMPIVAEDAAPQKPTLVRTSGQREPVAVKAIDSAWNVTVQNAAGATSQLPASDFVTWGERRDSAHRPILLLADGGVLVIEDWSATASQILVPVGVRGIWNESTFLRTLVRGLFLRPPADAARRDVMTRRIQSHRSSQDQLWLDNDDVLTGTLLPRERYMEGKNENRPLKLRTKSGEIEVAEERVQAVLLGAALGTSERSRRLQAMLGFRDGTSLYVQRMETKSGVTRLELFEDQFLSTDTASLFDELVSVQTFGPHVTYLSDLTPIGYKHIPFLTQTWPYGTDHAVAGGWLRKDGHLFTKGLGMHSTSRLAYELGGQFKTFQAELALDELTRSKGSVTFRVIVDRGEGAWQTAYESPVIRGGEKILPIHVDVKGANRLALIVDFADRGDELDHANWLNARLH